MKESITYEQALINSNEILEDKIKGEGIDIFKCSTALAIVFKKTKEETFDDLLEFRQKKLKIKGSAKK